MFFISEFVMCRTCDLFSINNIVCWYLVPAALLWKSRLRYRISACLPFFICLFIFFSSCQHSSLCGCVAGLTTLQLNSSEIGLLKHCCHRLMFLVEGWKISVEVFLLSCRWERVIRCEDHRTKKHHVHYHESTFIHSFILISFAFSNDFLVLRWEHTPDGRKVLLRHSYSVTIHGHGGLNDKFFIFWEIEPIGFCGQV